MTLEVTFWDKEGEVVARGAVRRFEGDTDLNWEVYGAEPGKIIADGKEASMFTAVGYITAHIVEEAIKKGKDIP